MGSRLFFCIFLCSMSIGCLYGQRSVTDSLSFLLDKQLSLFPQEKIHLHTDKPYYISGEKIWFRAYLVDAVTHLNVSLSRFIYVELIDPLNSVVSRVKIASNEEAYYGHLPIPADVPEGDYMLRAYTTFMRSQAEDYFFSKTVHIGDPRAMAIDVETRFRFESDRRIYADFRFTLPNSSSPLLPKSLGVSINDGKMMDVSVEDDGRAGIHFDLPVVSNGRVLLLEVNVSDDLYRQFISIPVPDNDFDVSFYPEGGPLLQGAESKIAFKAVKSNGQAAVVRGIVYNQDHAEVAQFETGHLGMGIFALLPAVGASYYAVCENDRGEIRRFNLPEVEDQGAAIAVSRLNNQILVSVKTPAKAVRNPQYYLLAHTRGMVHLIEPWDHQKNLFSISKEWLPPGVLHLVLFDSSFRPLSERLFFVHDSHPVDIAYQTDSERWARRSLVKNKVTLRDAFGEAMEGDFSVSVTSDLEVQTDTTSHILTQLLLSSDLRGHIENPAYYFQGTAVSDWDLDVLMCTQGWRRYNMAEMAQGQFARPTFPLELGVEISGIVKNFWGRVMANADVSMLSFSGNSFSTTKTDAGGRFSFPVDNVIDSTRFMVNVAHGGSIFYPKLILDEETFPKQTLGFVPPAEVAQKLFASYINKAERQYVDENGERENLLPEAVVTAQRKPPRRSMLYGLPDLIITEEELAGKPNDIVFILNDLPGVRAVYDAMGEVRVTIRGGSPILVIDDVQMFGIADITFVNVADIAQIDVIRGGASLAVFGTGATSGVIAIHTKRGDGQSYGGIAFPSNIKTIMPLAYQAPVVFYAPKYETEAQRNHPNPDRRTTIHWQPIVQTDKMGVAWFEFYTADEQASYTVVIEGLTASGDIIRKESKIWTEN